MAHIFAAPDIAALVSAFPPPLPTKGRPWLVKSLSGDNLLDSREVISRFRVLLETSPGRIGKADLPSRLGIEKTDWLLDCYDGDVFYGKDLQTLISENEAREVLERLRVMARDEFVEVGRFASSNDLSRPFCDRLISQAGLRTVSLDGGGQVVGDDTLFDGLKRQIMSDIGNANGDKVDLTSLHASIPRSVLLTVAEQALEEMAAGESLAQEGERVLYIPADYHDTQAKKREEYRASRIECALRDLSIGGFCDVESEGTKAQPQEASQTLSAEITVKFGEEHNDVELVSLDQSESDTTSTVVIAKKSFVDEAMKELEDIVKNMVMARRQSGRSPISVKSIETDLCDETSYLGLTQRLLRSSEYRSVLETTLASAVRAVEDSDGQQFANICQTMLLGPLELYRRGLQTVPDRTLNERLSVYICEHIQSEAVSDLAQKTKDSALLHDKTRAKEMEKLTAACTQAKTTADIQFAVTKFGRKMKISPPENGKLSEIKREILQRRLNDLQKTSRASDVLINLIWIMLAQQSDGLLMSAGKDTSRMIKHYQSIGDAEKGQKLETWRDLLKTGEQSNEDVQQMKAMAAEVFTEIYNGQAA